MLMIVDHKFGKKMILCFDSRVVARVLYCPNFYYLGLS